MTFPVFDGHNDTLLRLEQHPEASFFQRGEGHLDLVKAREGGLAGGFFAVFVPTPGDKLDVVLRDGGYGAPLPAPLEPGYAKREADKLVRGLKRLVRDSQGEVALITDASGLERALENGTFAAVLHFEGAEPLGEDPEALGGYYQQGLRSLGLVWSRPNAFAHGVPFQFPGSPDTGPGLSDKGKALVKLCNQLGVMIDLSHLNAKGFWEVAELSEAPLVATHSNAHALCPSTRNLTDEQLAAIKDSDGMVGLNFAVSFLREDGGRDPDTPLKVMIAHLDYLIDKLGETRVGLGSDFDGAMLPYGIRDASGLPHLFEALKRYGYDDATLERLAYRNWLDLLKRTWR
jgi:membrane dipeptidase